MGLTGGCHCGRNRFEVDGELPAKLTRCTCSICSKRGMLHAYFRPEQLRIVQADSDAIYRWNTKNVGHHFCSACGCSVWRDSPNYQRDGSWDGVSRRVSINACLLDDFEAADWPITVIDGKHLW